MRVPLLTENSKLHVCNQNLALNSLKRSSMSPYVTAYGLILVTFASMSFSILFENDCCPLSPMNSPPSRLFREI